MRVPGEELTLNNLRLRRLEILNEILGREHIPLQEFLSLQGDLNLVDYKIYLIEKRMKRK